jgi:hypothetical protein
VAHADLLAPVTTAPAARQALPFGAASIELIAICALVDQGDLDRAEDRGRRMRAAADEAADRAAWAAGVAADQRTWNVMLAGYHDAARYGAPQYVRQQDQAIAARLQISARTVQTHLAHVYARLGITSRTGLSGYLG